MDEEIAERPRPRGAHGRPGRRRGAGQSRPTRPASQSGDVITGFDGERGVEGQGPHPSGRRRGPGQTIPVEVWRDGEAVRA